ncbi:orotidine-5'-phosphate decarboxylase [Beijerinckia indica]|uniref:Orotidine 5'-phosphate decarboxylase n=1 Tax=Beijerinckia indica subsp. indica (strain ATCC 9039 / DSM 1715 / NCIMB 8712) TaxID=395963 RepID=B2IBR7_BEII9|nr:orotidine-5'-phosphate decarboxylase [Beijerinckia indica]ACB93789.1 orotidine 5'-phosphate decarboxylase [Beijerinckia indica subsp. indica ATCC 9039]
MNAPSSSPDKPLDPRDRLIVALDVTDPAAARTLVNRLGDSVSFYKIGMELAYGGGLPFASELLKEGKKVFLDLKLHDIATTVSNAVAQVARLGVHFLTVHAYPQTLDAARRGAVGSPLKILGVSVLTSYDDADLAEAGYAYSVADLVARRALQAREAGVDGLVLSAAEAAAIRSQLGSDLILVTPGIRPRGTSAKDQKRVATPSLAIAAGADHLVVGRPITVAPDPKGAADQIVAEIEATLASMAPPPDKP